MPAKKSTSARERTKRLESTISSLAGKVSNKAPRSEGSIVLRCTDTGEEFSVDGIGRRSKVSRVVGKGVPAVQVWGPSSVLQSILDGEIEASRAFAHGEIRVRGDLPYLEGVLKDLGLLECE